MHAEIPLCPGPSTEELGRYLRELRLALGFELDEVAQRGGVDVDALAEIEAGCHDADTENLLRLARGLGIRLGTIFRLLERGCTVRRE